MQVWKVMILIVIRHGELYVSKSNLVCSETTVKDNTVSKCYCKHYSSRFGWVIPTAEPVSHRDATLVFLQKFPHDLLEIKM